MGFMIIGSWFGGWRSFAGSVLSTTLVFLIRDMKDDSGR